LRAERSVFHHSSFSKDSLERVRDKEASWVVALPSAVTRTVPTPVGKCSGYKGEFNAEKIVSSLMKAGASEGVARKVGMRVKKRFAKATAPVTTRRIEKTVIEELTKADPRVARELKKRKRH